MLRPARAHCRPGFTLVETLVAVGIMILLAGLLVVALGQSGIKAKETATLALIRKVSNQVQERLEALDRLKSQPQWAKDAKAKYPSPTFASQQASILLLKDRMKLYFPQSFAEYALMVDNVVDPQYPLSTALPDFKRFLDPQKKITILNPIDFTTQTTASSTYNAWQQCLAQQMPPMSHSVETENAALLYYMVTSGKAFGIPTLSPDDFKSNEVADTDNDGLLEFVDAWGRPLRFYRWPTRLVRSGGPGAAIDRSPAVPHPAWLPLISGLPAAANPDPLAKDADDPTLQLYDPNPMSTISKLFTEANYHTPQTYHDFLIVSSGSDGQKIATSNDAFGLFSPIDQYVYDAMSGNIILNPSTQLGYLCQPNGKFDALTDNITNRNR